MRESQFLGLVREGCTSGAVAYDPILEVGSPGEKWRQRLKNGVDAFAVHKSCHGEEYRRSCGRRSRGDKSIRMRSGIQNLGSRQSQVLKTLGVGVRDCHQGVSACEKAIEDRGVPA